MKFMVTQKKPKWEKYSPSEFVKKYDSLHDSPISKFKKSKKTVFFSLRWDNTNFGGWIANYPLAELKITEFDKAIEKGFKQSFGPEFQNITLGKNKVVFNIAQWIPPFNAPKTAYEATITILGKNSRFYFRHWQPKEKTGFLKEISKIFFKKKQKTSPHPKMLY